jgi:hypothetical protein
MSEQSDCITEFSRHGGPSTHSISSTGDEVSVTVLSFCAVEIFLHFERCVFGQEKLHRLPATQQMYNYHTLCFTETLVMDTQILGNYILYSGA